jgi:EAL domain-containing protein (putative c-di-GMP-specific phosphodiesterase class I)
MFSRCFRTVLGVTRDRSFTAKIDTGEDDLALLGGIVGLGKALGLQLVAEGIERDTQEEIVQELGCDGAQSFYLGRPEQETAADETIPASSEAA